MPVDTAGFNIRPGRLIFKPGDFVFELLNLFGLLLNNQALMLDKPQHLFNQRGLVLLRDRWRY